ncbi:MAG: hypothetical protein WAW42_06500 [Candidatus Competibacteraceae bacterium]
MSKTGPDSDPQVENFPVAAFRHWRDAQLLERENCVENADQLYGLTAECAIKKALVELPAFARAGMLDESYRKHINELWGKVNHQSLQKRYSCLCAILKAPNPFLNWHIDQRYAADGVISIEEMHEHRDVARRLLGAVRLTGQRK